MPPPSGTVLLPAAGLATRMGGLPKFALPTGTRTTPLLRQHAEAAGQAGLSVIVGTRPEWESLVRGILSETQAQVELLETDTGSETFLRLLELCPTSEAVGISLPDTWISTLRTDFSSLFQVLAESDSREPSSRVAAVTYVTAPIHQGSLGSCVIRDGCIAEVHDKKHLPGAPRHWGIIGAWAEVWRTNLSPTAPHAGYLLDSILAHEERVESIDSEGAYFDCGTIRGYLEALTQSLSDA